MDYDRLLSRTILEMKPSGIRRFFSLAAEMDDVISLGVGEPDFKTPWEIRNAGIESLQRGRTWYTANAGLLQLRTKIAEYLSRRFSLKYDPDSEIIVTVGGSEGIDITLRAFIEPGDEILIPEPCFVAYAPIAKLSGGVPVPIKTGEKDSFRLTPEALRAAITEKTKLLVFPFPNNPTGAVMRREHLEQIAEVIRDTDIMVLSDEIYAELTYGDTPHVSIASLEGMREHTVVVNGFSKSYAMTGWRLGYLAAPRPVAEQLNKIHQYAIMCAPTTAQYAAVTAISECDGEIENMRSTYNMRRLLMVDSLNKMGLTCFEPEGTFYVFPSIKSTGFSSEQFCQKLLAAERVAVIPGDAFGESGEGYVRISYSYSIEHLVEALKRIKRFLTTI